MEAEGPAISKPPKRVNVSYEFDFSEVAKHFGEKQVDELVDKLVHLMNRLNIVPAVGRWGAWDKSGKVMFVDDERLRSFDEINKKIIPPLEELLSRQEWMEWRVIPSEPDPDEDGIEVYEFSAGRKEEEIS
jgi:hypothetical protein